VNSSIWLDLGAINCSLRNLYYYLILRKKKSKKKQKKLLIFYQNIYNIMSLNSLCKPTTNTTRGSVSVFFGPMFSGKSTTLLKKIEKYEKLGKSVLVVNYAHDNRYSKDAMMVTHNR